MNRFPLWKYVLIGAIVLAAALYTVPNFYGESPAIQVSSGKVAVKVDNGVLGRVEETLKNEKLPYTGAVLDATSVRVRFPDTDVQLKARDAMDRALNPDAANTG